MIIKRHFPNKKRLAMRTAFVVIGFFVYIILTTILLNSIDQGKFAAAPVYEKWFGKYFMFGHLGALSGIILLFLFVFILTRINYLGTPVNQFIKKEKEEFFKVYQKKFGQGINKAEIILTYVIMIGSLFLPVIVPYLFSHYFLIESRRYGILVGILLMFIFFYGSVGFLMKKSTAHGKRILNHTNKTQKNTSLKFIESDFDYTLTGVHFVQDIEGKYKGRKIKMEYQVKGGKHEKSRARLKVKLRFNNSGIYEIEEKNPGWEEIKAKNTEEAFNERFIIHGKSVPGIERKKLLVNFERPIRIIFTKNGLLYDLENPDVLPFYSTEGMILFFDFLTELADNK